MLKYFFSLSIAFIFAVSALGASEAMIVSFVTAHLNHLPEAVQGVLVTPSGEIHKTTALGPFGTQKIVINTPEKGTYLAYYEALIAIQPKYCYIVGGVDAHLCNNPEKIITFKPSKSRIQGFTQSNQIKIGEKTLPIASFQIK